MKTLLFYYCLLLVIILTIGSSINAATYSAIPLLAFLPITIHFLSKALGNMGGISFPGQKPLRSMDLYYSFILVSIMTIAGFFGARNIAQLVSAALFLPLVIYFIREVLPKNRRAVPISVPTGKPAPVKLKKIPHEPEEAPPRKLDLDRRKFLRLLSTAGVSLFIFSLFTKKAEAAFFGSVPGPGTVALKDTLGVPVDPASKHPTDGYKISEVDDASPAYYGFVEKTGKWFIMKEDTGGAYRYVKGDSGFSTNWTNRASLTYGYYDAIF